MLTMFVNSLTGVTVCGVFLQGLLQTIFYQNHFWGLFPSTKTQNSHKLPGQIINVYFLFYILKKKNVFNLFRHLNLGQTL